MIYDDTETNWQKFIFHHFDLHFSYALCMGHLGTIWSSDLVISRPKVRLKTGSVFFSSSREQKAVTSSLLLGFWCSLVLREVFRARWIDCARNETHKDIGKLCFLLESSNTFCFLFDYLTCNEEMDICTPT